MKLSELLSFDRIVIQCHDNPDADAVASGYGLLCYFQEHGKTASLIYGGTRPMEKSNLVLMAEKLNIPIRHTQELEEEPELLITVDCQYGERNVQHFSGRNIAVIDHHQVKPDTLPELQEIRSHYGSCATIVWDMLCAEDFQPEENLATALYYGLYMDTGKMQELRHPKDKDLRDALEFKCNKNLLFMFCNSNLSLSELEIAGEAFGNYDYCPGNRFAVAEARSCDPNILGIISDTLMEVDKVDVCIAFCMLDCGAKISVRSCVSETRANELTAYLAHGLGAGGGHPRKSGGFLKEGLILEESEKRFGSLEGMSASKAARRLLYARLEDYFQDQDIYKNGTACVPDLSGEPVYQKKRIPMGYVRATDMYPAGTRVNVRMLEGDFLLTVQEDTYFIIGAESEVYKNDEDYFLAHNDLSSETYIFQGEYAPTVREAVRTEGLESFSVDSRPITSYARTCIPKGTSSVHAKKLERRTKIFVPWSDDYMLGEPGDWIVSRKERPEDIYIVKKDIFSKTYEKSAKTIIE